MSLSVDIRKKLSSFSLDVQFEVGDETLGFLGASGCGKSMTLRCIAGVETPDEGKIIVDGKTYFDSAARINLTAQERKTALLFQNFQLFPNFNVAQNIAAGIDKKTPVDTRKASSREVERFQLFRLGETLSGVFFPGVSSARGARAHAAGRSDLMIDEPFSRATLSSRRSANRTLSTCSTRSKDRFSMSRTLRRGASFLRPDLRVQDGRLMEQGPSGAHRAPNSMRVSASGCKNITQASYVDDHTVHLKDWNIDMTTELPVPRDVRYVGIRAYRVNEAALSDTVNVFHVRCNRVSDSRFERIAMLGVDGAAPDAPPLMMKVDTVDRDLSTVIGIGDEIDVYVNPQKVMMCTR